MNTFPKKGSEDADISEIQIYSGLPRKRDSKSAWENFRNWFLPWLNRKRELGEEFLEAEVRKRHAEAAKLESETLVNISKARHIASLTASIEEEKMSRLKTADLNVHASVVLHNLEQKLNELKEKYDGDVIAEIDETIENT